MGITRATVNGNLISRSRVFKEGDYWRWQITDYKGGEFVDGSNSKTQDRAYHGLVAAADPQLDGDAIYIAIPHQKRAEEWYETGEDLGEGDRYLLGDHDLHSILKIDDIRGLLEIAELYRGHQSAAVHALATEILNRVLSVEIDEDDGE